MARIIVQGPSGRIGSFHGLRRGERMRGSEGLRGRSKSGSMRTWRARRGSGTEGVEPLTQDSFELLKSTRANASTTATLVEVADALGETEHRLGARGVGELGGTSSGGDPITIAISNWSASSMSAGSPLKASPSTNTWIEASGEQ
jgi:hypothetical protein